MLYKASSSASSSLLKLPIPIVKPGRNIVTQKIDIPGFCSIHFTITFAGQTNVDRYIGNIVIPKIVKLGFHCNGKTSKY